MAALATRAALVIDHDRMIVTVDGEPVDLQRRQYDLLTLLASDPTRCFTQDTLAHGMWGDSFKRGDALRCYLSTLRAALGGWRFVVNVRGVGYRLVKPGDEGLVEYVIGSTG